MKTKEFLQDKVYFLAYEDENGLSYLIDGPFIAIHEAYEALEEDDNENYVVVSTDMEFRKE